MPSELTSNLGDIEPGQERPQHDDRTARQVRGAQPSSHRWSPERPGPRGALPSARRACDPRARPRPPAPQWGRQARLGLPAHPASGAAVARRRGARAAAPRPPPTFLPSFPGAAGWRAGGADGGGRAGVGEREPGPGLAGGRGTRGPGSPPPPPPGPARPPARPTPARTPPTQGRGPGPLTWTAVPPAPAEPRRPPRPRPAGPRPADTEAEVRPAAEQTDSPRSPLAAPGARASAAARPISALPEGRAGRRDYATRFAGAATPPRRLGVPPRRKSDVTDSQSQQGEAGLCRY